eukprot:gene5802-9625_t
MSQKAQQYVDKVISFSSEGGSYPASNLIGPPSVYPSYGNDTRAWSPQQSNSTEFLELKFSKWTIVQEIEIYETFNPGHVVSVSIMDPNRNWDIIWSGSVSKGISNSRIFKPAIKKRDYPTKKVRLELKIGSNYSQIDAIQLIGKLGGKIEFVNQQKTVSRDLLRYYNCEDFSDIQFQIGETKIYGHSLILECYGDKLEKLILESSKNNNIINITFTGYETLTNVLKYVYGGRCEVTTDNVNGIIKCCDILGIDELKSSCFDYLVSAVTKDTVCELIMKAKRKEFDFDAKDLVQSCLKFIDENTSDVLSSDYFGQLDSEILIDMYQRDNLSATEMELFNALVNWSKYQIEKKLFKDKKELDSILLNLAKSIRYPMMSSYDLVFVVKPTKLAPLDLYIQAVEYHAKPEKFKSNTSDQFKTRSLIFDESKLIEPKHGLILNKWVPQNTKKWKLIYRASKDGFTSQAFHKKCDSKGATLTVIKSSNGNIFGGYTSSSWDQTSTYKYDSDAFIFSLKNKDQKVIKMDKISGKESIYCDYYYGPTFGGGHDFYIYDRSNSSTSNYSNLGHSYKPPNNYSYGSTQANSFLAGSYNFKVSEIEVFMKV